MQAARTVWIVDGAQGGTLAGELQQAGCKVVCGSTPPVRPRAEVAIAELGRMGEAATERVRAALEQMPGLSPLFVGTGPAALEAPLDAFGQAVLALEPISTERLLELVTETVDQRRRAAPEGDRTGERQLLVDLPSSVELVEPIVAMLTRECRAAGFPDAPLSSAVPLCLTEAIINAVTHGNGENPGLRARVKARFSASRFWCSVEDEGEGFDPAQVPPPTAQENLLKSHGRGLFLMRHYMDEVTFNSRGNAVTLLKRA